MGMVFVRLSANLAGWLAAARIAFLAMRTNHPSSLEKGSSSQGAPADTKIDTFVKRGDVLVSCWKYVGREISYYKCGAEHYDWYIVSTGTPKSGYVPVTCARKL
jgi:hypothetical protein